MTAACEDTAMRTIGILGGMSWESSIHYERVMNIEVRRRLGGTHSADLVIRSYDFARIEAMQAAGQWRVAGQLLASDAVSLQDAGAEGIVLCTNTMHLVADAIEDALDVPIRRRDKDHAIALTIDDEPDGHADRRRNRRGSALLHAAGLQPDGARRGADVAADGAAVRRAVAAPRRCRHNPGQPSRPE